MSPSSPRYWSSVCLSGWWTVFIQQLFRSPEFAPFSSSSLSIRFLACREKGSCTGFLKEQTFLVSWLGKLEAQDQSVGRLCSFPCNEGKDPSQTPLPVLQRPVSSCLSFPSIFVSVQMVFLVMTPVILTRGLSTLTWTLLNEFYL